MLLPACRLCNGHSLPPKGELCVCVCVCVEGGREGEEGRGGGKKGKGGVEEDRKVNLNV